MLDGGSKCDEERKIEWGKRKQRRKREQKLRKSKEMEVKRGKIN